MSTEVSGLDLLDAELYAAGSVVHGVAGAAVLVVSVLDVVTQQLFVGARPPHGELLYVRLVLVVVQTGQSSTLTGLTEHLHGAAWRHRAIRTVLPWGPVWKVTQTKANSNNLGYLVLEAIFPGMNLADCISQHA